jgi:glycerol-3-phosphate dehydrogenase
MVSGLSSLFSVFRIHSPTTINCYFFVPSTPNPPPRLAYTSCMQRANLSDLETTRFDLIVIGAGINGAAIARDAAMRGLSVCLLEMNDLASGTSAWSSRLVHGGLRYLEHYELGLVRESLRERERLLRNAPHLVSPLPMVVPIQEGAKRGPLLIRAGMVLYDILSYDKSLPLHRMLSPEKALDRVPALDPDGLKAAAVYYDAQVTFAERLVVENVLSAVEHGAQVVTHATVTGIVSEGAVVRGVEVRDTLTGAQHRIAGRVVVNVAGPWVDQVLAGAPKGRVHDTFIGGTKGSHIIVDRFEGAPTDAIYYESRSDHRPILVIPFNGMIMLGSTDIRYDGALDRVEASDAEVDYLLSEANALFRGVNLTPDDVRYSYAGIRPLPRTAKGSAGAITRRHMIKDHAPSLRGLWSVIGGKLTTHRSLAEEFVDKALRALGRDSKSRTDSVPLPGAAGVAFGTYRQSIVRPAAQLGVGDRSAYRLVDLYGTRAEEILALIPSAPALATVVDSYSGAIAAEAAFAVQEEMALSLADILLRRTMIAYGPHAGIGPDERILEVAGKELGWTKPRQLKELAAFREWIQRYRPRAG